MFGSFHVSTARVWTFTDDNWIRIKYEGRSSAQLFQKRTHVIIWRHAVGPRHVYSSLEHSPSSLSNTTVQQMLIACYNLWIVNLELIIHLLLVWSSLNQISPLPTRNQHQILWLNRRYHQHQHKLQQHQPQCIKVNHWEWMLVQVEKMQVPVPMNSLPANSAKSGPRLYHSIEKQLCNGKRKTIIE